MYDHWLVENHQIIFWIEMPVRTLILYMTQNISNPSKIEAFLIVFVLEVEDYYGFQRYVGASCTQLRYI